MQQGVDGRVRDTGFAAGVATAVCYTVHDVLMTWNFLVRIATMIGATVYCRFFALNQRRRCAFERCPVGKTAVLSVLCY